MTRRIEGVIFDLDGTLVHSGIDFVEMKRRVMDYLRSSYPDLEGLREVGTITELIEELEKRSNGQRLRRQMVDIHGIMDEIEMESAFKARPLGQATEVVSQLRSMGLKIGLLTRSCGRYAETVIERTLREGSLKLFDAMWCREPGGATKPDPRSLIQLARSLGLAPGNLLVVGDHIMDGRCATEAGALFAAVTYGSSALADLEALGPIFLVEDLSELPQAIGRLIRGKQRGAIPK